MRDSSREIYHIAERRTRLRTRKINKYQKLALTPRSLQRREQTLIRAPQPASDVQLAEGPRFFSWWMSWGRRCHRRTTRSYRKLRDYCSRLRSTPLGSGCPGSRRRCPHGSTHYCMQRWRSQIGMAGASSQVKWGRRWHSLLRRSPFARRSPHGYGQTLLLLMLPRAEKEARLALNMQLQREVKDLHCVGAPHGDESQVRDAQRGDGCGCGCAARDDLSLHLRARRREVEVEPEDL
ncbi:hypothetical protein K438DRAFT_1880020 [Mycena galopus ATCC 62051]|nr:hypothetical protein K438DRAFT_1880020 [Mycena galopus ATCC 62051]